MTRVIPERDRRAIRRAHATVRAQNQNLFAAQRLRSPPHPGILRQAEQISRGLLHQHLCRNRQRARGSGRMRAYVENSRIARVDNKIQIHSVPIVRRALYGFSYTQGSLPCPAHRLSAA
jgi:hypothetical protein